jgi:hypothetical protein
MPSHEKIVFITQHLKKNDNLDTFTSAHVSREKKNVLSAKGYVVVYLFISSI